MLFYFWIRLEVVRSTGNMSSVDTVEPLLYDHPQNHIDVVV